ncbi:Long-chain-fatty-acid--CoA ligase [Polaromonas sp. CG9_12]|nr:Long-chain-fatty-acid--CoA ligase [Polaromonas sp. CG9_12]
MRPTVLISVPRIHERVVGKLQESLAVPPLKSRLFPPRRLSISEQADMQDGRIRIRGRIKEIIVTSTGEKVPPGDLELAIAVDPLFAQVLVVGENRPFIGCVAVVNPVEWRRLAASLELDAEADASLNLPAVRRVALTRVAAQARNFARCATPRAIFLTRAAWTVESTLMTPTLKLKRSTLMARFAVEIESMYRTEVRQAKVSA